MFDSKGNWQGTVRKGKQWPVIDINDWAPGVVTVPVEIDFLIKKYDTVMFAGHMGNTVVGPEGNTIQPYSGWAIALK